MSEKHHPYLVLKRILDFLFAIVLIVVTLPLQIVIFTLVTIKLGSPAIFRQPRPGKNARVFTLYKFRTMLTVDHAKDQITDADRLTPFGKKLRATSLDELPSLFNVLRGDMSMVGPRPLLVEYLYKYTPEQARRHEVRPGVTGLAQVRGRNSISWEEKFQLDTYYVDNCSLKLDLLVLFRTIAVVFQQHGISSRGEATMSSFEGS